MRYLSSSCLAVLLLALTPPAIAQAPPGDILLSRFDNGATLEFFVIDPATGRGTEYDQLRRAPTDIRAKPMDGSLFAEIGRPAEQAAIDGELHLLPVFRADGTTRSALFVETSTGYTAYFDDLGRNGRLGELKTVLGRPFGPLAGADGNFVLLNRRSSSGRSAGAYLLHGGTGKGLYIDGLESLEIDPNVVTTVELEPMAWPLAGVDILDDEQTSGYWLIDGEGKARRLEVDANRSAQLTLTAEIDLAAAASGEVRQDSGRRFVAVAIDDSSQTTIAIAIVDVTTGGVLVIDDPAGPQPRTRATRLDVYRYLQPDADQPRSLAVAPAVSSSGRTLGFWLVDSLTRSVLYVSDPSGDAQVERVTVER